METLREILREILRAKLSAVLREILRPVSRPVSYGDSDCVILFEYYFTAILRAILFE